MPLARTGVLVGLLISLVAVTLQNQTPAFSLVFLGMRSRPFPLGIWIIGAIAVGMAIGLLLLFLLRMNRQGPPLESRSVPPRRPRPTRSTRQPKTRTAPKTSTASDWDAPQGSDWGPREAGSSPAATATRDEFDPDASIDEQRYARAGSKPPSTTSYSRSASDPEFSSQPGQRESVFEAEYRMVNPPKSEPPQEAWDDLEEDFFD